MPPLPDVPHVIRCDLFYDDDENAKMLSRFFMGFTGALSQADCTTFAHTLGVSWNGHMASHTNTHTTMIGTEITDLGSLSSPQGFDSVQYPGTLAGDPTPAGVSLNINFKIARRYKGGKPKVFLPGRIAPNLSDDERWLPGPAGLTLTAWEAFMADNIASAPAAMGVLTHVNVSYFHGFTVVISPITGRARNVPTPRVAPVVDLVTAYTYDPRPGSQRRRNEQGQ